MSEQKRQSEVTLPITWTGWDEMQLLNNNYYDVIFTEDFGVFKKGESFSSINVDYANGSIEAYNQEGTEVVKTQNYVCKPVVE